MGTPEFAEYSLRSLVEDGFDIVGVVTVPDKPIGRHGSVLSPSPVKQYAVSRGIPVLQPEKLKDEAFLSALRALNADLQIVVAFRMLPEVVWSMPPMGTFNLHASLLPQYRGAAPINWAVINGETETGATTFFLKHEIDTGDIIGQVRIPISDDDNADSVHDRLMTEGAGLLLRTAKDIISGNAVPMPQPECDELRPAPKIFKETCKLKWNARAESVRNLIRGLSPYPAAWSTLVFDDGRKADFKIYGACISARPACGAPGTVMSDGRTYMDVCTGDGRMLSLCEVQLSGKKRMGIQAFLCGTNVSGNCFFEPE